MLADIDVAYFSKTDLSAEQDRRLQDQLQNAIPAAKWEVTNQAAVHLWFERHFGYAVAPLRSLEDAVAT